jgi:hypothetical protein
VALARSSSPCPAWEPRPSACRRRAQRSWTAVVGLRDLVLGGYVLALALLSARRAVGIVLGTTVLIPLGNVLVLLAVRGFSSPGHLLPHSAGAGVVVAAAARKLHRA